MGEAAMRADETMSEQVAGKSNGDETMRVDHPNVAEVCHELTFEDGKWRYSLIVLTDLPLNPKAPDHDTTVIDTMVRAVVAAARANNVGYDKLCIRNA